MQALQAHFGGEEEEEEDEEIENGVKQIWQADFWEGGLRKVHLEHGREDDDDEEENMVVEEEENSGNWRW